MKIKSTIFNSDTRDVLTLLLTVTRYITHLQSCVQEEEKATIGFGDVQNLSLDKVVSFLILGNYK